eukprot:8447426-Karenia_brevis.AAC.1
MDELAATEHPGEGNASEASSKSSSSSASGSDISVQAMAEVDWVLPEKPGHPENLVYMVCRTMWMANHSRHTASQVRSLSRALGTQDQ